jgi:hypothetical protein
MMHLKKGEAKKKGIMNPSCFSFFSFVGKHNYSTHHQQQMSTSTNPLNLLSPKKKKKGEYNHGEFVDKNSTQ